MGRASSRRRKAESARAERAAQSDPPAGGVLDRAAAVPYRPDAIRRARAARLVRRAVAPIRVQGARPADGDRGRDSAAPEEPVAPGERPADVRSRDVDRGGERAGRIRLPAAGVPVGGAGVGGTFARFAGGAAVVRRRSAGITASAAGIRGRAAGISVRAAGIRGRTAAICMSAAASRKRASATGMRVARILTRWARTRKPAAILRARPARREMRPALLRPSDAILETRAALTRTPSARRNMRDAVMTVRASLRWILAALT